MRILTGAVAVVGTACALAGAADASAQVPGYQQLDPRQVGAEYRAEVLDRINEVLADWGHAWAGDELDELLDQYWENATLIPAGRNPLRGLDAIRGYFEEVLPQHGHVEAFMLEFEASGGLAQVFGNYMIGIQQGRSTGTETGPILTVYAQRGRTWKIRTQVFLENPGS